MSFIAILLALLLEQARPLGADNSVHRGALGWVRWAQHTVDAGQQPHGWLAWLVAVVVPTALAAGIYLLLAGWNLALGFVWMVAVLYVTLGFRQFSHYFTTIREALESGDEVRAREVLAEWRQVDVSELPRQELLRHVIEYAMVQAHRHVLGVLVCVVVFAAIGLGPAGAVFYRLAEYVSRAWCSAPEGEASAPACSAAARAWHWADYLPVRVTAVALAVVGNFEEAIASWRQDARHFANPNDGILLAATSGAINVRLGGQPLDPAATVSPESVAATDGRTPQLAHLASVVGAVWRSVVLWMLLLALGVLARLV